MNKPVLIKLRGVAYKVRFLTRLLHRNKHNGLGDADGDCESPRLPNRTPIIRIRKGMTPDRMLEVVLHEMLHGCLWDMDEKTIDQTAKSLRQSLYKMGFRIVKKPQHKGRH
jgi:hypothetical protein